MIEEDKEDSFDTEDFEGLESSATSDESSSGYVSSTPESEEDADEDPEDNTVDITLEFFDPKESDFQGLKALLQSFLDGESFGCSELVDTIIKQSTVGTVVKSGDHAEPVGVLTVLNTQRYKDLQSLKEIKAYLLKHCKSGDTKATLEAIWGRPTTGLLISERLVNCPPQLAPPLQQALFDEISWAVEDEPTQELRDSFKIEHYIAISRAFTDPTAPVDITTKAKKQKKQKVEELIVYARPEDEYYHKHCSAAFTFPTRKAAHEDELEALRLVMLLTPDQITRARAELDSVVGNLAAEGN